MAEQQFNSWPTSTASGDFPLPGTGHAACEPEVMGDFEGKGEADRAGWGRFFDYCDRVIVTALRASAHPGRRSGGLPPGNLARPSVNALVAVSRRQLGRVAGNARAKQGGRQAPMVQSASGRFREQDEATGGRRPPNPGPDDERDSVVRAALAELEEQIDQRSYTVFFLRTTECLPFSQIANVHCPYARTGPRGTIARKSGSVGSSRGKGCRSAQLGE